MAYLEGDKSVEALILATQEAAVQIAQEDRSPALGRASYNMHPRALAETVVWLASPGEASLQRLLIARDDASESPFQVNPFQAPALSDTLPPMPLEDSDHLVRAAISVARPAGREVSEGVGKDNYEPELEDHELDVNFDNEDYIAIALGRALPSYDGMYPSIPVTQQSTMYHYTSPRGEFYLRELRKYIDLPADYPITQMVLNLVSSWHKTRENVEDRHPSLAAAANSIDFTRIDKESGLLRAERQILEVWLVSRLPLVGWWGEAPQVKEIIGRRFKQTRDPSPLSRVRYDFD
ncbi:hypothetical protein B0T26DRAFT_681433 [Lasiosphaeria miniovina]|uniref:Uncharacterized protein n=1 Tax=Lasiosphaeria miniovina TaxID=1954250 RepID=A0AA40DHJ5_9PEZI|nr:uncharacterized protein B0T26DRAFT_681433 [Lasiosphaeria miniovina]KAK0703804.1 hypothetical protein B0T26DRAFT_681433 [Lasiosphaeria miniovina]